MITKAPDLVERLKSDYGGLLLRFVDGHSKPTPESTVEYNVAPGLDVHTKIAPTDPFSLDLLGADLGGTSDFFSAPAGNKGAFVTTAPADTASYFSFPAIIEGGAFSALPGYDTLGGASDSSRCE